MSDKLEELFISFVKDIIKVFPEYEKRLNLYYKSVLTKSEDTEEKERILNAFMLNMNEISKALSEDDTEIFDKDPIILQNVSFKVIWKSNISKETRINIWKYLQSLCIQCLHKNEAGNMDELLKSLQKNEKITDKESLIQMKRLKKLSESLKENKIEKMINNLETDINIKDDKMGEGLNQIESLIENSSIGKIAKEVSEELNIEEMLSGGGGIENIINGGNMANIFQSISSKIESTSGNEDIMQEAMDITKSMGNNPLFSSLMQNMVGGIVDPSGVDSEDNSSNMDKRNIQLNESRNVINPTQERLRNKLKKKKEMQVNKTE